MKYTSCIFIIMASTLGNRSFSQRIDSTHAQSDSSRHTSHIIHENIPKSKFWGNAWYSSIGYNLSKVHEFDINIGRTYGTYFTGGGGSIFSTRSWGAGYGLVTKNGQTAHLLKAFAEYSFFYFPPYTYTFRGDYFYDLTNKAHYLRPSAGLNLVIADLLYNYSFNVSGTNNLFRHGVTLRFKYFKRKKWENIYPSVCRR